MMIDGGEEAVAEMRENEYFKESKARGSMIGF